MDSFRTNVESIGLSDNTLKIGSGVLVLVFYALIIMGIVMIVLHFKRKHENKTANEKFSIVEGKKTNMTQLEISQNVEDYKQKYYLTPSQLEFLEKGGDYTDAEKQMLYRRPTPVGSSTALGVGAPNPSQQAQQAQQLQMQQMNTQNQGDATPFLSSSLMSSLCILACCFIFVAGVSGITKAATSQPL